MYVYIWSTQRNSGEHLQGCSTAPLHNSKYVNKTRTSVHGALCVCVGVRVYIVPVAMASICQIIKINTTLNRFRTYMVRTWSDELRVCCSVYAYILYTNQYIYIYIIRESESVLDAIGFAAAKSVTHTRHRLSY